MIKYLQKNNKINSSDPQYITAFEKLKNLITTHPILKYPEFDKQFVVTTDASDYAIGAVLSQQGHPICYVSRTLNKHEKSYSTTDKEFLAIVYSVNYFRPYLHGNKFKIRTDHLPIKYMNDKYKGKEFSQRHQRWLLKLQEYNFEIEYLKGHENKVADYLSRLTNAEKIRKNNETESNMQISSTEVEESRQWIRIKEEIVNKYKLQLILTYNIEKEIQTIHNRKIIEINPLGNEDYIKDLLKCHIKPGIIGIFADVSDRDYHKIQLLLISTFSTSTTKFVKCTLRAKEILNEDDLHKQISLYHTEESLHSGINECYNSLKNKIYFPKLREHIHLIINNCQKCQEIKYDRYPVKQKFCITETPAEKNEVIHLDIFHIKKHSFVTTIDKLTKFAAAYDIGNRNWQTKKTLILEHFAKFGKPKKIIMDNEFRAEQLLECLKEENVVVHLTKPNSHTGNGDIERLHSTLIELITGIEDKDLTINMKMQVAINTYNNRYHTTLKCTPKEARDVVDAAVLCERTRKIKENLINKRNMSRETYVEKRITGPVKNYKRVRHKDQPYYRILPLRNIHVSNIKRPFKYSSNRLENP